MWSDDFFFRLEQKLNDVKMISMTRIFFMLTLSSVVSLGQTFEGKITYQNTYKSKIPNVTDDLLTAMMGTSQEFNFKAGSICSFELK